MRIPFISLFVSMLQFLPICAYRDRLAFEAPLQKSKHTLITRQKDFFKIVDKLEGQGLRRSSSETLNLSKTYPYSLTSFGWRVCKTAKYLGAVRRGENST